jgi:hypothetical protein
MRSAFPPGVLLGEIERGQVNLWEQSVISWMKVDTEISDPILRDRCSTIRGWSMALIDATRRGDTTAILYRGATNSPDHLGQSNPTTNRGHVDDTVWVNARNSSAGRRQLAQLTSHEIVHLYGMVLHQKADSIWIATGNVDYSLDNYFKQLHDPKPSKSCLK